MKSAGSKMENTSAIQQVCMGRSSLGVPWVLEKDVGVRSFFHGASTLFHRERRHLWQCYWFEHYWSKNALVLRIESPSTRQRIHVGKWNKSLKIYLHLEIWQCSLTSLNQQTNKAQICLWILWQLSCFFYFMLIWEQKKTKGKTRQSRSEEIRNRPVREPWCFSSNSCFGYAKLIPYYLSKFDCLGESLLPNDCTLQLEE